MSRIEQIKRIGTLLDIHPSHLYDGLLATMTGRPELDLFKLDEELHDRFPDYDDNGEDSITMSELIIREYGQEASNLVRELTGAHQGAYSSDTIDEQFF